MLYDWLLESGNSHSHPDFTGEGIKKDLKVVLEKQSEFTLSILTPFRKEMELLLGLLY